MIKTGVFFRFGKDHRTKHLEEWKKFKAAYASRRRRNAGATADAEDSDDDSPTDASPVAAARLPQDPARLKTLAAGRGAASSKMPRRFAAARAAVTTTRDEELLQVRDEAPFALCDPLPPFLASQLTIEGGIDFETLVWPTPVQLRVDPVTNAVVDLEVWDAFLGPLPNTAVPPSPSTRS